MAFPPAFLDELRSRLSLSEVVGRKVSLKRKSGAEYAGLCPFHNEKTPSFTVNDKNLALAGDRKVEHYLRAVKDLVADTSDHGPYKKIIDARDRGALSLTVALMEGYRKVLYPGIREAYDKFILSEDWAALEKTRKDGYERFRSQRDAIAALHRESGGNEDFTRKLKAFCAS